MTRYVIVYWVGTIFRKLYTYTNVEHFKCHNHWTYAFIITKLMLQKINSSLTQLENAVWYKEIHDVILSLLL